MKLVCQCYSCRSKITLKSEAKTRDKLMSQRGKVFMIGCPSCNTNTNIHVNLVQAEPTKNMTPLPIGAIGGAIIGILGGPLGMIIGGSIGGVAGGAVIVNDNNAVKYFNSNFVE